LAHITVEDFRFKAKSGYAFAGVGLDCHTQVHRLAQPGCASKSTNADSGGCRHEEQQKDGDPLAFASITLGQWPHQYLHE